MISRRFLSLKGPLSLILLLSITLIPEKLRADLIRQLFFTMEPTENRIDFLIPNEPSNEKTREHLRRTLDSIHQNPLYQTNRQVIRPLMLTLLGWMHRFQSDLSQGWKNNTLGPGFLTACLIFENGKLEKIQITFSQGETKRPIFQFDKTLEDETAVHVSFSKAFLQQSVISKDLYLHQNTPNEYPSYHIQYELNYDEIRYPDFYLGPLFAGKRIESGAMYLDGKRSDVISIRKDFRHPLGLGEGLEGQWRLHESLFANPEEESRGELEQHFSSWVKKVDARKHVISLVHIILMKVVSTFRVVNNGLDELNEGDLAFGLADALQELEVIVLIPDSTNFFKIIVSYHDQNPGFHKTYIIDYLDDFDGNNIFTAARKFGDQLAEDLSNYLIEQFLQQALEILPR